jgi:hypothetical protein
MMLVTAAALTGCIEHEARLDPPEAPASDQDATPTVYVTKARSGHSGTAASVTKGLFPSFGGASDAPTTQTVRFAGTVSTGPLPISLRGDAWVRDQDGALYRGSVEIETPLYWWQRFPLDLGADLWPGTLVAEAHGAPELHAIPAMPSDDLTAEARANGFCHDPRPTPAGGVHAR